MDDIFDVLMRRHIATGDWQTAKEIAEAAGVSTSTARRRLQADVRVAEADDYRQSYSRDYPGMEAGSHRVIVYAPARSALIERIRELSSVNGSIRARSAAPDRNTQRRSNADE